MSKEKVKYLCKEMLDGFSSVLTPNKVNIAKFMFILFITSNQMVHAQAVTNIVNNAINWFLGLAALIFAFYVAMDIKPVSTGQTSIWKFIGKIVAGLLVLGSIALINNFESIAQAFKSPLDSATQKVAEELDNAVK